MAACLLAFTAAAGLAAAAYPDPLLVAASGLSSFLTAIVFGKMIPSTMVDRVDRTIFWGLSTIGTLLNTAARAANDGYMPVWGLSSTTGRWMPMDGARFTWMGDWLVDGYSIGDILLLMGALWVVYCIMRWSAKNTGIGKRFQKRMGIQFTQSREDRAWEDR